MNESEKNKKEFIPQPRGVFCGIAKHPEFGTVDVHILKGQFTISKCRFFKYAKESLLKKIHIICPISRKVIFGGGGYVGSPKKA